MTSRLKRELASRHLYDRTRGKPKELSIVAGFLERLQLDITTITEGERPDFSVALGDGALIAGVELTL